MTMFLFDLLFLGLAACALAVLAIALIAALRGQRRRAAKIVRNLLLAAIAYLSVVYVVAAVSKRTVLHVGDPECDDDWCVAVDRVTLTPRAGRTAYDVTLRIFSRALRVSMHEYGATDVYLVDSNGRRYDPLPRGTEVPLNTLLEPGQSITTSRLFDLPSDSRDVGLIVGRRGFPGPVCLVIGECDAIHGAPVIRLER